MLDVFITVDVEVWCNGWKNLDAEFPEAFRRYVYGPTPRGEYGLPRHLQILEEHGLAGVFFVEPLFATRFGLAPLEEIVGLFQGTHSDVQLHLHTEWVDESLQPLLPRVDRKRQHLRDFSREDQTTLIAAAAVLLRSAGAQDVKAFRAGNFGFNRDTLLALADNGFLFDSSYNASLFGLESGVRPGQPILDATELEGVYEYPMTVFKDGVRPLRQAALTACSYHELEGLLWQALNTGRRSFVILSHNFELLNASKTRADEVVVDRFQRLCALLDRHRDVFRVACFRDLRANVSDRQPPQLTSPVWRTAARMAEQLYRRRYA